VRRWLSLALLATLALGCRREDPTPAPTKTAPRPAPKASAAPAPAAAPFRFPSAERIVAIGDVHGDLEATRRALRLAGAIDEEDDWSGGALVVVQTGDQLDRGDDERAILDLFDRLRTRAPKAGGKFIALNGNHETMTVAGDFRYVTPGGFTAFDNVGASSGGDPRIARLPPRARGRAAAFFPGGAYARKLAEQDVAVVVGDSVFVHAGVLLAHVDYGIGRINAEVKAWMQGDRDTPPRVIASDEAPVWTRLYGTPAPSPAACEELGKVLERLGAKRMVVGHTVQENGITSACDERVYRIDVGMARAYGSRPVEALEIRPDGVRVLREAGDGGARSPSPTGHH